MHLGKYSSFVSADVESFVVSASSAMVLISGSQPAELARKLLLLPFRRPAISPLTSTCCSSKMPNAAKKSFAEEMLLERINRDSSCSALSCD